MKKKTALLVWFSVSIIIGIISIIFLRISESEAVTIAAAILGIASTVSVGLSFLAVATEMDKEEGKP